MVFNKYQFSEEKFIYTLTTQLFYVDNILLLPEGNFPFYLQFHYFFGGERNIEDIF